MNRISVASSVGSFGSVEEEEEGGQEEDGTNSTKSLSPTPSRSTSFSSNKAVRPKLRQQTQARHSLPPPGSLPSFASVLNTSRAGGGGAKDRSSSPLRPRTRVEYSEKERMKREERRLRIAEELRDTEKAYVQVLEEIDAVSFSSLIS